MYSLIFCYDKKDWEEPCYLKFLKALQEDTGNIFSYLVSVNIVNICLGGGGDNLPPGKVSPPSQPSCMLSFLCNDKKDLEKPGHLKFLNALQEDTENNFSYLVPVNIGNGGGGGEGGQSTPG